MPSPFQPLSHLIPIEKRRRLLPHWEQRGCTYFLTWRMADAVTESVYRPWKEARAAFYQAHPKPWDETVWSEYHEKFSARMDEWMDAGHGSCVLRAPELREVVVDCLRYFDGVRYDLEAWVVMPNHVHVLACPRPGWELVKLLHTWKSFTASRLNKLIRASGSFWMDESFDHIVRNEAQLKHYRKYVRENGAMAHLAVSEFTHWQANDE